MYSETYLRVDLIMVQTKRRIEADKLAEVF